MRSVQSNVLEPDPRLLGTDHSISSRYGREEDVSVPANATTEGAVEHHTVTQLPARSVVAGRVHLLPEGEVLAQRVTDELSAEGVVESARSAASDCFVVINNNPSAKMI